MLFCTVLLAMGSSVLLTSFMLLIKGMQTLSDCLLNRLGSLVRSTVFFSYHSGSVSPTGDKAVLKLLSGNFDN